MDYALVNLVVTIILLVATVAFRKRILRALGRLLLNGAIEFARGTFVTEEVSKAEDGTDVRKIGLSAQGRAIVGAAVPVLLAEVTKNIKIKLPQGLPPGLDVGNMAEALPQLIMMAPGKNLNLGGFKIPKELAAAGASLLRGFLPGAAPGTAIGKGKKEPVPKELEL